MPAKRRLPETNKLPTKKMKHEANESSATHESKAEEPIYLSCDPIKVKNAADNGNQDAQALLGYWHASGIQILCDRSKAEKYLRKASEDKTTPAGQFAEGICYKEGIINEKDQKEAVKNFENAALENYPPAIFLLGRHREHGIECKKNELEAIKLYRKAANEKYAQAENMMGYCCAHGGCACKQDEKLSLIFYKRAAEKGYITAMNNLGICYDIGRGCVADRKQAVDWFKKAANKGQVSSLYNLGRVYLREARKCFKKAANSSYIGVLRLNSLESTCPMHSYSPGILNFSISANMFSIFSGGKNAAREEDNTSFDLGNTYLNKASTYFTEAASKGHKKAGLFVKSIISANLTFQNAVGISPSKPSCHY